MRIGDSSGSDQLLQEIIAAHDTDQLARLLHQRGWRFLGQHRSQPIDRETGVHDRQWWIHHLADRPIEQRRLSESSGHQAGLDQTAHAIPILDHWYLTYVPG